MINNLPLALHIGYHKTATTFLQKYIFSQHPDIFYLGRPDIWPSISPALRKLKFEHDLNFDYKNLRKEIFESLSRIPIDSILDKKIQLISLESLHSGEEWFGRNIVTMSYRLKKVFPQAKIIIGIRSQAKYIESNYKEYIIHGGKMNFNYFLFKSFLCNKCLFPKLQYDKVIQHYQELFEGNVFCYIYDSLIHNKKNELKKLFRYLGISENFKFLDEKVYVGMLKPSAELSRLLNKFMAKDFIEQYYDVGEVSRLTTKEWFRRKLIGGIRKSDIIFNKLPLAKTYLKKHHFEYINNTFTESNKNLCKLLNRDLQKLGFVINTESKI